MVKGGRLDRGGPQATPAHAGIRSRAPVEDTTAGKPTNRRPHGVRSPAMGRAEADRKQRRQFVAIAP